MDQTSSSAITVGAMEVRFLVEGSESGGSVSVFECDVPADAKMPVPHSHDGFEETVCGLEGTTTWTIDGEQHEIGSRQAVCIPRGSVQGLRIAGQWTQGSSRSLRRASSAPLTSRRSTRCSPAPADRRTWRRSQRS